jgi:hypothetical protein
VAEKQIRRTKADARDSECDPKSDVKVLVGTFKSKFPKDCNSSFKNLLKPDQEHEGIKRTLSLDDVEGEYSYRNLLSVSSSSCARAFICGFFSAGGAKSPTTLFPPRRRWIGWYCTWIRTGRKCHQASDTFALRLLFFTYRSVFTVDTS